MRRTLSITFTLGTFSKRQLSGSKRMKVRCGTTRLRSSWQSSKK